MSSHPPPTRELHISLRENLGWLHGLARHLVQDECDIDDLVQDTVAAALHQPPLLDRPLRPWLARVMRTLHLQELRGRRRRRLREVESASPESLPGSDEIVERLELAERLVVRVRALPEPYRTVIAMRYREGLEPREIARQLNVAGGTVRWRIHEGLARLRSQLDSERGGRSSWVALLRPLTEFDAIAAPSKKAPIFATVAVLGSAVVVAGIWIELLPNQHAAGPASPVQRHSPRLLASDSGVNLPAESADGRRSETPAEARAMPRPSGSGIDPPAHQILQDQGSGGVAGRVLDQQDHPVSNVTVTAYSADPFPLAPLSPSSGARRSLRSALTGVAGRFSLAGLPTTPVQLQARSVDGMSRFSPPFRLEPGRPRNGVTLRIAESTDWQVEFSRRREAEVDEVGALLQGHVEVAGVLPGDRPLAPIYVRFRRAIGEDRVALQSGFRVLWRPADADSVRVNVDGHFNLPLRIDHAARELGIEFLDSMQRTLGVQRVAVPADLGDLVSEFTLGETASLHVTAALDPLETILPTHFSLTNGDGTILTRPLDEGVELRFCDLAPGAYQWRWSEHDGSAGEQIEFIARPAADDGVRLILSPGEVRRLHLDRRGLTPLRIRASIDDGTAGRWTATITPPDLPSGAPQGSVLALNLSDEEQLLARLPAPGAYGLRIFQDGEEDPAYIHELDVGAEGVELQLEVRLCVAVGRWYGELPARRVWLRTERAEGGSWLAEVDVDAHGALRIERAAPGIGDIVFAPHPTAAMRASPFARINLPSAGTANISLP